MANEFNLEVTKRDLENKGALKQLRKDGKVPGIYYSHDSKASIPFYIEKSMLREAYKSGARIFNITVGPKKRTVIFKAVDYHPVTDEVIHVDLYGVKMDRAVNVNVQINLVGDAAGIKEGGILVQGQDEIEIECLPMDIPEFIEVDISALELGAVLRVENLQLDKKLSVKSSEDQIIASVTHPMAEEVVETIEPEEGEEEFLDEGETSTDGDAPKEDSDSSKDAGDSKAEE
jgi:large subunit ribosomal protein L25